MKSAYLYILLLVLFVSVRVYGQEKQLERIVSLKKQKNTVYYLLNYLTEKTGIFFIYDSKAVNSDQKARLLPGDYALQDAIVMVLGSSDYILTPVDHYVIIERKITDREVNEPDIMPRQVKGRVCDEMTGEALPYCTVSIPGTSLGSVANSDGSFILNYDKTLTDPYIYFSYLGYESKTIPAGALLKGNPVVFLKQKIVPLQEVIVRMLNPRRIVEEVLEKREQNYAYEPVEYTTFYREGILKRKELVSLSEAIFQVYKSGYDQTSDEQFKLLKMRRIVNTGVVDSMLLKMKAGLDATLQLDIMRNPIDFLVLDKGNQYNYVKVDMTEVNSRLAHVIAFEQLPDIDFPCFRGKLYIDAENSALLSAEFEVNPRYIAKAGDLFIVKKSRNIQVVPQQVIYTVSYKEWSGKYYINHLRGDLYFKLKKRKQLFTIPLHTFFEMVTGSIDTLQAKPFERKERMTLKSVFTETAFDYDRRFWDRFNIIPPEESLNNALSRISLKIEETESE